MKKKFFFLFFLIIFPFKALCVELAIVDIDFLIKNSKKGQNIQKEIKTLNDKNIKTFEKKEKELKEKESQILAKKNVLSETDFQKEVSNFQNLLKKYNSEKNQAIEKIQKKRNTELAKLLKDINIILIDYAKKNNISTTVDKKYVIITKKENDITEQILKLLNN